MTDHINSYYAATANKKDARPPLSGSVTADVCVIGGGFTGVNAALELTQRGRQVMLLEAVKIGFGASGRNGGQIVNGYSRDLDVIASRYGKAAGQVIGGLAREGGNIIRERVADYNIQCDLKPGGIFAALTHSQMRGLTHHMKVWREFGFSEGFEPLDKTALQKHVKTERYVGGLIDHHGGHLHPLNLVQGEAAAFEALGGVIYEESAVTEVKFGETVTVKTAQGEVTAKNVLVCGNAYLHNVLPDLEGRVMPVSTQVLATEPLGEEAAALLPTDMCVEDCNYILDYFRRTADNRILYGGGIVYGGQDPESVRAKILPLLHKTFPSLKEARIDFAWSGNFALTLTRFPQIGKLAPNVFFSHGDSGHGVTTTHLLARLLAEAVTGDTQRFDVFAGLPYFPFPGGRNFRVPLTVAGSWWYRFRDWLKL
ncbi:NAD(P)/FAD-dependent oxidoreductase [Acidocella aminolytica]|uniref:FAD dependent oxidoreductase n=1 Tax=Acidocella aminolytica 101 = DSM 11237 TaxID=1120923 RepID=A0A0D6PJ45_9PROT|nr:FAD-binding oxidoreductase [Acidocella aminolytica]GAN80844.1 FAD dependent oxidoreductase [Acidocella aminolytica 101 = DSM 11237]GBQ32569.1 glycine/D-amino acid oxidase [Acidocella aminolytica 101 = DSM 11237]SHE31998.1 gamma-glutamylputrescine oxidase [Acidocella aminolytica 101 = DSM 11237]